jgi:hypothetical protein
MNTSFEDTLKWAKKLLGKSHKVEVKEEVALKDGAGIWGAKTRLELWTRGIAADFTTVGYVVLFRIRP